jgi:nicotine blue oxidoreductase
VLAAGAGSRFVAPDGTHKLLALRRGRPVVSWAVQAALDSAIGPVWVVTGAADLRLVLPAEVRQVANRDWAEGQATSLATAVDLATDEGIERIVVGLGDQPLISPSAWRAVADAAGPIAVATYGGRRGNPVGLARPVWAQLPRTGDAGARVLIKGCPSLVQEVACEGMAVDVDTVEDLNQWS